MRRIVAFFLLSVLVLLQARAVEFTFKQIGVAQGLAGSQVNTVCKDSHGFMWFGTSTGLTRYDGYRLRNFRSDFANSTALPDNNIESVQEDGKGVLWIRANGSYVAMLPDVEQVDRSVSQRLSIVANNLDPELIYVDKRKNLWVYDRGKCLYYYKINEELVYAFDQAGDNPIIPSGTITGLCETPEGVVAIFSDGRVIGLNTETQSMAWGNDLLQKNRVPTDEYKIFYDSSRNIWAYGLKSFYFYDSHEHTWYRSLSEFSRAMGDDSFVGNELVTGVSEDSKGRVWISTDREGLFVFHPKGHSILAHITSGLGDRQLQSNYLQTVFIDDMDVVWIGTQRHGACFWAQDLYMFDVNREAGDVNDISIDGDGNVWLATRNKGLACMSKSDGKVTFYGREAGLSDNVFACVLASKDGSVWVGSSRYGLSRMKGNAITNYNTGNGLLDNNVQALMQDLYGNIWIGTKLGGLQCLNMRTGIFSNFNQNNEKLPSNNVTSLYANKSTMVVGTSNGIVTINLSNNDMISYTGTASGENHFSNNFVSSVYLDSRGLIWVGTSEGLNVLNREYDALTVFTVGTDGLPSNTICGLAEDKSHNMWVTTSNGACCITVKKSTSNVHTYEYAINNYDVSDGLQGMEFNQGAIFSSPTDGLFFGGHNGLNQLNRRAARKGTHELIIILSSLTIDGQEIRVNERYLGRSILSRVLNSTEKLTLAHTDRDIRISLALNDYGHSEHARFTYMLEGLDEGWQSVLSDGHTIRLKDLKPGHYTLHIRASLDNGKTSAREAILQIEVQNVWYLTWWALSGFALLLLILIYIASRFFPYIISVYKSRIREIGEYRNKKEQLEDFANEIRQDVIAMIPQLGLLQLENENAEQKERLLAMQHTIRQFLNKLNALRQDRSLIVNDAGMKEDMLANVVEEKETKEDDSLLLIADSGVVHGNGMLSDSGEIEEIRTLKYLVYLIMRDADMLEFMEDCLKGNYQIRTFTSCAQAWQAMEEETPSLIMCAHDMDEMTGSEYCNQVKSSRAFERIPFILVMEDTLSPNDFISRKITLMADDYIPQPMNLKAAIARINNLLGEENLRPEELENDDTMRLSDSMTLAVKLQLRQQVDDYVMQNISRKDLSIEELSRVMGISRTFLFRKIENVTGRVPADYIRAVRLQEASKLLMSGSLSVSDVAEELGFANTQNFSYYFKLEYGMLPSEYVDVSSNRDV